MWNDGRKWVKDLQRKTEQDSDAIDNEYGLVSPERVSMVPEYNSIQPCMPVAGYIGWLIDASLEGSVQSTQTNRESTITVVLKVRPTR
jgi:hypothetical protein